jgi:hypothetical protein
MNNLLTPGIGLSGTAAPYVIQFIDPNGLNPGTWSDDGSGNMTFAPFASFAVSVPGGFTWLFSGASGLSGPGFACDLNGNVTCNSVTIALAGLVIDNIGNISGTSLSIGGVKVIAGQLAHIANATATIASLQTTLNNLLAGLQGTGLMA